MSSVGYFNRDEELKPTPPFWTLSAATDSGTAVLRAALDGICEEPDETHPMESDIVERTAAELEFESNRAWVHQQVTEVGAVRHPATNGRRQWTHSLINHARASRLRLLPQEKP